MTGGWRGCWLLVMVILLLSGACTGIDSGNLFHSKIFTGNLLEDQSPGGEIKRLSVQGAESWAFWDRNSRKEDDGGLLLKVEFTF